MKTAWRHKERTVRVGILTTDNPHGGLWRDAESLVWALKQAGNHSFSVSLFCLSARDVVERDPVGAVAANPPGRFHRCAPAGTRFVEWCDGLDSVVSCEYMMPRAFDLMLDRGITVAYVPNLDWAVLDGRSEDTGSWVDAVRRTGAQVWCKTPAIGRRLQEFGIQSRHVPWSIPDPVVRQRKARAFDGRVRYLMNAGNGGYQNRRGVDIALAAFRAVRAQDPGLTLTLKTIPPLGPRLRSEGIGTNDGVKLIESFYRRSRIGTLYRDHDCVLHPSRWEGFGLVLLEALHAGLPVIGTNGWPMNELFSAERSGIGVRADAASPFRLAPRWECDAREFAAAILRFARDPELASRMACADIERLEERQRSFVSTVQRLLAGESPVDPPGNTSRGES